MISQGSTGKPAISSGWENPLVPTDPTFRYWSHLFGTCHYLFSRQLLFFHHLVRLNKFVNQINMLHAFLIMLVHML